MRIGELELAHLVARFFPVQREVAGGRQLSARGELSDQVVDRRHRASIESCSSFVSRAASRWCPSMSCLTST